MMKSYNIRYFIQDDRKGPLGEETSKIRNTLMYITSCCIIMSFFIGGNITQLIGIKVEGRAITVTHILIFLIGAIVYLLIHFLYKYNVDMKAYLSGENIDKENRLHHQIDMLFDKELYNYVREFDDKVFSPEGYKESVDLCFKRILKIIDGDSKNQALEKKISHCLDDIDSWKSRYEKKLEDAKALNAEIERRLNEKYTDANNRCNAINSSLNKLMLSLSRRSVNNYVESFFNLCVPLAYSIGTVIYVIVNLLYKQNITIIYLKLVPVLSISF